MRTETMLRLNKLIGSPKLKFAAALACDCLGLRHLVVRFDPVMACNIRCGMCYFSDDSWLSKHPVSRLSDDEVDRLAGMFFPQAIQLHIGCQTEPTMYKNFPKLVAIGKQYGVPFIGFTTNAQLLTAQKSASLIAEGLDEITISTHGVFRETYEGLMKKASYLRYHENLADLVKAKRAARSDSPRIRINYTVNPDNLEELRVFFDVFAAYEISCLQVRPIYDNGNTDYKKKDLGPFLKDYDDVMDDLTEECHRRGVILLANRENPTYDVANSSSFVYEKAFYRYLGPERVWRDDFDWRKHTYKEHKRKTEYHRELLKYIRKMPELTGSGLVSHEVF
jgi:MoaA/NifB/PqqE/SkfB family radical SAM enzyme